MSPKHDSDDESRRISMSAIYRQLDDHLAADEEPYDVRAGLERLVDWMGEEAPSEQATELLPEEVVFTGQSGTAWRYWTDQPLGTPGGFGGVYAAQGPAGESMAVKVVQKARPSGQLDNRLLRREVEIGRRVAESGSDLLLPVVDVAETDEALVMVMARADGALANVALPMDDSAVTSVLMDIASGLQQLHSIGIIHRDLKPANILMHAGRWKLADFGIARDQEIGTQNPTFVGWGSPPYMAPELWANKSPTVKTDLYALGCVAFQLLSGAPPYTGDNVAVREGHLSRSIPGVSGGNVTLRNLIMRLLAKDPGERPQDARAVLERLQRAVMPRSPVQEAIARGLGSHAVERSREAAKRAAIEAAREVRNQHIAQARADLLEIASDALEELQQVEPDAVLQSTNIGSSGRQTYSATAFTVTLVTQDARLRIEIWDPETYELVPEDTLVLACAAIITNRRWDTELNAANLVYEQVGDRLRWQVYRFSAGMVPPNRYEFGPYGRTHGLSYTHFFSRQERYFMIHPALHIWQKAVVGLTPETFLDLFREAVDLRPPDSRTGIWPRG
jgi:serine/threonine protein kinase